VFTRSRGPARASSRAQPSGDSVVAPPRDEEALGDDDGPGDGAPARTATPAPEAPDGEAPGGEAPGGQAPDGERPRRPLRAVLPAVGLAALIALYVAVFGTLTWRQQSNFGTFAFDMGIYDQGIWLLSRFHEPFSTVRGLNYFAHHVNVITVALVPAYWLGAGPHFLYLVETVWMALGALPVWLLARDRLGSRWLALALAAGYLLFPSLEWINWWHFHPDALIITPLLFAWWLASRRRWGWYAVAVAVALLCKEDAGIAVAALGVALLLRGRRRAGVLSCVAGVAWFLLATKVIIPVASGGDSPFYVADLFPGYGDSLGEILVNLVAHPSRLAAAMAEPDAVTYYQKLLAPVALMPFAAPEVLLVGVPQAVINTISGHPLTHDIRYHYSSIVIAAVFIGTVEGCARLGWRPLVRRSLVVLVLATSAAANVAWSPSPIGTQFDSGIWVGPRQRHEAIREALAVVPRDAGVAATYYLVPHLSHRVDVYEFPNPWTPTNWGSARRRPDPATVRYLVLDTMLSTFQRPLYDRLVGEGKPFEVAFEKEGIVVARRVAPG
jgi:uncharacterized membrane protein